MLARHQPSQLQHAPGLRIELISGLGALQARRAEWAYLWQRAGDATPFQSPAWLLSWAHHFAPDRIRALAAHTDGELLAFVPFFTWDGKLLLAGTGPSDYGDGLFAPATDDLAGRLLPRLCEIAVDLGCASVDLQQLRAQSPLLHASVPHGWSDEISPGTVCPLTTLVEPDGVGAISAHWRKNAQRAERVLQREYDVALDCIGLDSVGLGTDDRIAHAAQMLQHLHTLRWGQRDSSHAFSDRLMHAFLHDVIGELAADGLLRLQCLRIGTQTAALVFAIGTARAHYFYMSGFDPRWSRYSTGLITILGAMRQAAAEGAREFHFLRGNEAYKYHLGAQDRPTFQRIFRPVARRH